MATHVVTSQQQLAELLSEQGFDVTQATLSRDLDELHAAKTRMPDGTMAYAVPTDSAPGPALTATGGGPGKIEQRLMRTLSGLVTSVASAGNLVVVHTPSGAAQYVAGALDRQSIHGVLGTIAGDDTVMLVARDEREASATVRWLLAAVSGTSTAANHAANSTGKETS